MKISKSVQNINDIEMMVRFINLGSKYYSRAQLAAMYAFKEGRYCFDKFEHILIDLYEKGAEFNTKDAIFHYQLTTHFSPERLDIVKDSTLETVH